MFSLYAYLLAPSCLCRALLSFGIEGNSFNLFPTVDLWMVGEWTKGYLAHVQLPHCEINSKTVSPWRPREFEATTPRNQVADMANKHKMAT